ncbi:MAG: N-formylglutamate amidohydrolase [Azospirillaceae bacterium]
MTIASRTPRDDWASLPPLLHADDPPAFTRLNPGASSPILLLGDHAGRAVPAVLGRLGLGAPPFERHIAYDIGVEAVVRALSRLLDATAIFANNSRLVIDPNRQLIDPTSNCVISDGVIIPGNRGLTWQDRARRVRDLFEPYHAAIEAEIEARCSAGDQPIIVSVHSFTPVMNGFHRPWHVGLLWGDDGHLSMAIAAALRRDSTLVVGENEPYSGKNAHGYTMEEHVYPRGLANVLVELRQDLVSDAAAAELWAERLADAIALTTASL